MREWKLGVAAMLAACGGGREAGDASSAADTTAAAGSAAISAVLGPIVEKLETPESARFDPELGVYFVSNINGSPMARDGNGFITRLTRDGQVDSLKFIEGGRGGVKLNAPKGLAIKGDTLWVADIDAARAFNKRTGKPIGSLSLTGEAKFLNDAALGPDGAIYLTDTGVADDGKGGMGEHTGPDRVFRLEGTKITVAMEFKDKPGPNGITWDSAGNRFIMVPFMAKSIYQWSLGDSEPSILTQWAAGASEPSVVVEGPGGMDGIEALGDGRFVFTSWADSSLYVLQGKGNQITGRLIGGLPGPADIALDRERGRIAVPQFTQNRLQFVDLRR